MSWYFRALVASVVQSPLENLFGSVLIIIGGAFGGHATVGKIKHLGDPDGRFPSAPAQSSIWVRVAGLMVGPDPVTVLQADLGDVEDMVVGPLPGAIDHYRPLPVAVRRQHGCRIA